MAQGIYDKLEETLKLLIALNKQLCCEPSQPTCNFLYQGTLTVGTDPEKETYIGYLFDSFGNISPFNTLVQGIVYGSVDSILEVTISSGCYEYIDLYINGVKYTLLYIDGVYKLFEIPNPPFVVGQTYAITICPGPNCGNLTTTTSTQAPEFFRASSFIALAFADREGVISSRPSWYGGNTVASITASNPNLVTMRVSNTDVTGADANNYTLTYKEDMFSPGQPVSPTYTTFDGVTGYPILKSVRDFYEYAVKIINNTYLSARNPSIFIKRVSSSNGLGTGIYNDALFLIGIDIDATGNERWGYDAKGRGYDPLNIPGTLNIANFTYSTYGTPLFSLFSSDTSMYTFTPSTTWVNGVTIIPAYNVRVEENFTIPPGW